MDSFISHSKPKIGSKEKQVLTRIIDSGRIDSGPEVLGLEDDLRAFFGSSAAVVSSGTAALHLALLAVGVKRGDTVAIPTHTCPSVLYALQYIGAKPALFDCGTLGIGIDPDSFQSAVHGASAAIIVHTYGFPVQVDPENTDIPVIEDCAHALGAKINGKPVGIYGKAAVLSFYPTKMIAGGESGAVISSDEIIQKVKQLRSPRGADDKMTRFPYSASDLCAGVARVQLPMLPAFIRRRRAIAREYIQAFRDIAAETPVESAGMRSTWYRFILKSKIPRDEFIARAYAMGIIFGTGVRTPVHRLLDIDPRRFPNSEAAYRYSVSVPIYPALRDEEIEKIKKTVTQICESALKSDG